MSTLRLAFLAAPITLACWACDNGGSETGDTETDSGTGTETGTDTDTGGETGQNDCWIETEAATACHYENGIRTLYEPSAILSADTCEVVEECGFGSACFQEPDYNGGEASCARSIDESQADKPYYDFSCATFSMWLRHPTRLEMDCRCRTVGDGQGGAGGSGNALADPNHTDIETGARPGGPIMNCMPQNKMEDDSWPITYGEGPSFNQWYQVNASGASWYSGTVDPERREMYAIVLWTDPSHVRSATVVAWDLDTGDRRVISGIHPTLGEVGSGYLSPIPDGPYNFPDQPLTGANVIQLGADGYLYTFGGGTGESASDQREIVRIDRETGERTLVWLALDTDGDDSVAETWGQCLRPEAYSRYQTVALNAQAFEVGPDGEFYVAFRGRREGDGIARISADGKTCEVLSAWGGVGHSPGGGVDPDPAVMIGTGPTLQFPVEGLLLHEGEIYGVSNNEMYRWELDTGDWHLVTTVSTTFGGMGHANMFWDETRKVIWAVGNHAARSGAIVDPATGRRESIYADTGRDDFGDEAILISDYPESRSISSPGTMLTNGNSIGNGGFILDPDNNDIAYGVLKSGGLMKLEFSTFNNYVMSF
jgi:hypothetical protein